MFRGDPGLLGFPRLLGPAPCLGLVALQFASDRGQQALPQVLRNDEPLNPDRRPGRDGRSGNTAGKRRSAVVSCHAATPGARAPEQTRAWTAEHILPGQFNRNRSLSWANYQKVPSAQGQPNSPGGLGAANPMRSTVRPLARWTVSIRKGRNGAGCPRRKAAIDRTNAGVTGRLPANCPGDACVRSAKRSGMSASAPGAKPLNATM